MPRVTPVRSLPVLALAAVAAVGLQACTTGPAPAPESATTTVLRVGLPGGETDPAHAALTDLGQRLSDATEGRYSLAVEAGGGDVASLTAEDGVALTLVDGEELAEINGDFGVFNLPYVFDSPAQQADVLGDAELVGDLYASLEGEGVTVLGGAYGGARNLLANHAVAAPADVAGQRVSVGQSDLQVAVVESLGAVAVPLASDQVAPAFGAGAITGAEGTLADFASLGLAGGTFVALTQHQMVPDYLVMDADTLAGMTQADREALVAAVPETVAAVNEAVTAAEVEARATAEANGATFNEVEPLAFEAALSPVAEPVVTTPERRALYDAASAR
ncbi:TRAP transporter substrate-binding protein DctP [Propioniciclava soli]|uniref:TRAP transporter substrate-binding protein DctP n=1 Tax=Propioniciclava soli TaxID=2775081 RepID=A0ABZ3C6V2_9ACTN|nr:TRAP transporter substrate-binding protein DctP [Propioniciclava soli]